MPPDERSPALRRSVLAAGAAVPLLGLFDRVGPRTRRLRRRTPRRSCRSSPEAHRRHPPARTRPATRRSASPAWTAATRSGSRSPAAAVCRPTPCAAVLNVTATNPPAPGWVKVVPTGSLPAEVSNINVEEPGQILANLVTVQLPTWPSGQVDIVCYDPLDIVVDIAGAYVPATTPAGAGLRRAGAVVPRARHPRQPRPDQGRRRAGPARRSVPGVPAAATAVVVNLTVTESNGPGFWTAFVAGGAVPDASNVNTDAGRPDPGQPGDPADRRHPARSTCSPTPAATSSSTSPATSPAPRTRASPTGCSCRTRRTAPRHPPGTRYGRMYPSGCASSSSAGCSGARRR